MKTLTFAVVSILMSVPAFASTGTSSSNKPRSVAAQEPSSTFNCARRQKLNNLMQDTNPQVAQVKGKPKPQEGRDGI